MQEESERVDAHPPDYFSVRVAVNTTRSDHDVRDSELFPVLGNDLFLLGFREAVRFAAKRGPLFARAGFVQQSGSRFLAIAVHGKGTDEYESLQTRVSDARIEQVACGDNGIQKGVWKGLLARARG